MKSLKIEVFGRVQSVGFRPFIYNLAKKFNLRGYVKNKTSCVEIVVQGSNNNLSKFIVAIKTQTPQLALIEEIRYSQEKVTDIFSSFSIFESEDTETFFLYVPADIKICKDCLKELFNLEDRRYFYPFINCTQCGPRFTIIEKLPYDRVNTTMKEFKMCYECKKEYDDPANRRFHAQPNACYECGPGLNVFNNKGEVIFELTKSYQDTKNVVNFIVEKILEGKILAIKSYGGYHIVCDATNDDVVYELRKRKYREHKPFALMASSLEIIEKYCIVSNFEKEILHSIESPIILLEKKQITNSYYNISKYVSKKSKYYGFMLPYTPLQYLIFEQLKKIKDIPLIMTSGNLSDEPQSYQDDEVQQKLKDVVDYFVKYNRKINIRCDDSVVIGFDKNIYFIRRSRGWSPEPIFLNYRYRKQILSFGADLKNTFCLAKDNYAILSHHIGDIINLETISSYMDSIEYYLKTFSFKPEVLAYDLHPLYNTAKIAKEYANKNDLLEVCIQHHYAHMVSCMIENNIKDKCLGVIFDGTGYGLDGKIWGGEFLIGDFCSFQRKAYFGYFNILSTDIGIKQPYRNLLIFLYDKYKDVKLIKKIWQKINNNNTDKCPYSLEELLETTKFLLENNINIIKTSSVGRVYDLVALMCFLGLYNHYEGQLPQLLENECNIGKLANFDDVEFYDYKIFITDGVYTVDTEYLLKNVFEDIFFKNQKVEVVSTKFHWTIAKISVDIILKLCNEYNIKKVVLSGGVFQNKVLLTLIYTLAKCSKFEVFWHRKVPCNDGGISLGQTVIADNKIK
ncbi:MAG: carbamoyltransferase HypF [Endomicrobia bacterium]|nr:carbamoyltransferase HypF [Endomicrobiia bacterium]